MKNQPNTDKWEMKQNYEYSQHSFNLQIEDSLWRQILSFI